MISAIVSESKMTVRICLSNILPKISLVHTYFKEFFVLAKNNFGHIGQAL